MDISRNHSRQDGLAAIVALIFIVMGSTYYLLERFNTNNLKIARDKKTTLALAMAKEALIGYAAKNSTPGRLPCPENISSGSPAGQTQNLCSKTSPTIGRLPWKTLGLPELLDGNGDHLWYVVSVGFPPTLAPVLKINSDTAAQLTVDGIPNAAVAIIFSPGTPLNGQTRPVITTISPNASQYLDLTNNDLDNTFVTTGTSDTFNDKLLLITHDELFRVVEKRIAMEVLSCLNAYASVNSGHYPWAAALDTASAPSYNDTIGARFGRVPTPSFTRTQTTSSTMTMSWPGILCDFSSYPAKWVDWKELVFYAIADAYKPQTPLTVPASNACATVGACLTSNPPNTSANKQVIVFVAGQRLTGVSGGQPRTSNAETGTLANYLEDANAILPNSSDTYTQNTASPTFNDVVVYCYTDATSGSTKCWPN